MDLSSMVIMQEFIFLYKHVDSDNNLCNGTTRSEKTFVEVVLKFNL